MILSVIIPTLNEEAALPGLLDILRDDTGIDEIIVVDGGSTDTTRGIASEAGVDVVVSPQGRGQQLCHGAATARGDVLWFLHADTIPQQGAAAKIKQALLRNPMAPGGNFRVIFDGETDFARWLTGFYQWLQSHRFYYGDSGIFVRRDVYNAIGGIRAMALMEDYDFVRALERSGPTVSIDDPPVVTSSRRFQDRAPWRIITQWLVIHGLYYCNVSGAFMARLYRSHQHVPARRE